MPGKSLNLIDQNFIQFSVCGVFFLANVHLIKLKIYKVCTCKSICTLCTW